MAAESLKAAPPVTVAAATLAGMPVSDLVLWATLVYIVMQAAFLAYRWWRMATDRLPIAVKSADD